MPRTRVQFLQVESPQPLVLLLAIEFGNGHAPKRSTIDITSQIRFGNICLPQDVEMLAKRRRLIAKLYWLSSPGGNGCLIEATSPRYVVIVCTQDMRPVSDVSAGFLSKCGQDEFCYWGRRCSQLQTSDIFCWYPMKRYIAPKKALLAIFERFVVDAARGPKREESSLPKSSWSFLAQAVACGPAPKAFANGSFHAFPRCCDELLGLNQLRGLEHVHGG